MTRRIMTARLDSALGRRAVAAREVNRALRLMNRKATVEVAVVGEGQMRELNRRFRGKNRPTDVLSFPAHSIARKRGILGELVICWPVCRRQARDQGHSAAQELRVLVVHGVLHLLGYDHEAGAREAARMARAEAKLLRGRKSGGVGLIARVSAG